MTTVKKLTNPEPYVVTRRIGSTLYIANAYFSEKASETLADKILRLARNDGLDFQSPNASAQNPPGAGWSQERSTA